MKKTAFKILEFLMTTTFCLLAFIVTELIGGLLMLLVGCNYENFYVGMVLALIFGAGASLTYIVYIIDSFLSIFKSE